MTAGDTRSTPGAVTAATLHVCDAGSDERLLAWVRLAASSALLIRLITDTGPGHSAAVQMLAAVYTGYALLIVLVSWWRSEWLLPRVNALHAIDFAWTTVASTVSGGTGSHAFIYFTFVLAAAAFRWDRKRTLLNGVLILAVGTAQSVAAATGLTPWAFEFDVFLLRVSYIGCGMAVLFGILADRLHRARDQATAVASLVNSITRANRLREAISATVAAIARLMKAPSVTVVVKEIHTGRLTLWHAASYAGRVTMSQVDVPHDRMADWAASLTSGLGPCEFRRRNPDAVPVCAVSVPGAAGGSAAPVPLARGVLDGSPWRTLLAVPLSPNSAWTGQIYVRDPAASPRGGLRLRFLEDIVRHATPGLVNLYLLRRLRSRAESMERDRISRELHDTVNQSLTGIEMRLEVVRRHAAATAPGVAAEVAEIQPLLSAQSVELRQLVERLRHDDLDARRLPAAVANFVERFGRHGDVDARLEWTVTYVDLPPQRCTEVARIIQEALFNVRRHSGATRVVVRVESDANGWTVIVEDNGRGLGFTGRLAGRELDLQQKVPRVIRDRAVALGGSLAIESSDLGARLEITFPTDGGLP